MRIGLLETNKGPGPGVLLVVRGGIDPPTSGFSDRYPLFQYIPVGADTSQNQGVVTPTET